MEATAPSECPNKGIGEAANGFAAVSPDLDMRRPALWVSHGVPPGDGATEIGYEMYIHTYEYTLNGSTTQAAPNPRGVQAGRGLRTIRETPHVAEACEFCTESARLGLLSDIIGLVEVRLVVAGAMRGDATVSRSLQRVLETAFESDAGDLNVVLKAETGGYAVFFARAILEHAGGVDYSEEVRAAFERAGIKILSAVASPP